MRLDVFSDLVCPWCYIGKRRLDLALDTTGRPVDVVWRSFQLDPGYPANLRWTLPEAHLRRFGLSQAENDRRLALVTRIAKQVGLDYDLNQAVLANTLDAHRLVHLASAHGRGSQVTEALMHAYAIEGRWIGDLSTLDEIAAAAELPPLEPHAYEDEVRADAALAARYGVTGVPTIVVDESYLLVNPDVDQLAKVFGTATSA